MRRSAGLMASWMVVPLLLTAAIGQSAETPNAPAAVGKKSEHRWSEPGTPFRFRCRLTTRIAGRLPTKTAP